MRQSSTAGSPSPSLDKDAPGNRPLRVRLSLDPTHPYLSSRGMTAELVKTFGLGYCDTGIMACRICIPIHDETGTLVAYAGRWPDDDVPDGELRYKLPRGFRKSEVLFNLHRVAGRAHLVLVEGFWSVFRLHGLGVPAVALMGTALSKRQEELLVESGADRITVLCDADEAGAHARENITSRLARSVFVRAPALPDGTSPDSVGEEVLCEMLRG